MYRALPVLGLAFCAGAALRLGVRVPAAAVWALLTLAALLMLAPSRPRLGSMAALGVVFAAGLLRADAWISTNSDSVAHLSDRKWVRLHGTVAGDPVVHRWGASFDTDADRAETRREPLSVSGRVRAFLPPDVPSPPYGARVAVEGRISLPDDAANPGEIPPAQYLRRDGVVAVLSVRAFTVEGRGRANPLVSLALRARHALERGIDATLPPEPAGLLRGLLFSDTGALPVSTQEDFARSGTVHILSTSGLHVAILATLLAVLLPARRPGAKRWRAAVLLLALLFFALMTGLRPAVLRAVVMTAAVLAAPIFEREPDPWCALALAAIVLVAASPGNLLDPGFQLSFAAVLALSLWFAARRKPVSGRLRRAGDWLRVSVETSVIASLATIPLAVRYFGTCSFASPLSNLLVVPAVGPAMVLGLVQGALWPHWPGAAYLAAALNRPVLGWILGATGTVARWSWSGVDVGSLSTGALLAWYAALFGLLALRLPSITSRPRVKALRPAFAMAACSVALVPVGISLWRDASPAPLRVVFLDVGQGDCALIQTPLGRTVLIDTGGRYEDARTSHVMAGAAIAERVLVPALRRAGVRRVDALVLTHPHEDHAGGLPVVLARYPTGLWLSGGTGHGAPGLLEGVRIARARHISRRRVAAGDRLNIEPGVALDVLAPARPLRGTREDVNNNSLVCRLTYGRTAFLLCGDAEQEEEESLVRAGADLRADVLKAGHHGGASSSGMALLGAACPRYAVISCGRHNRYGHPAEATLERFRAAGTRVYRTDLDGGIVALSDGETVRCSTSRWALP